MRISFIRLGTRVLRSRLSETEQGFSLVSVLLLTGLLSALAIAVSLMVQSTLSVSLFQRDIVQARLSADAGINRIILALEIKEDSLQLKQPLLNVTRRQFHFQGVTVDLTIEPESGKLDINYARPDHLEAVFKALRVSQEKTEKIIQRLSVARNKRYLFYSIEEILDARDRLGPLPEQLTHFLTVTRNRASFDPRAASQLVLEAIPDLTPDELDAIYRYKAGADANSVNQTLTRHSALFAPPQPIYRILAVATMENGTKARREAIIMLRAYGLRSYVISWGDGLAPLHNLPAKDSGQYPSTELSRRR